MLLVPNIRVAEPKDAHSIFAFIESFARKFGVVSCANVLGKTENRRVADFVKTDGAVSRLQSQLASDHPPFRCILAEHATEGPVGFALYYPAFSDWTQSRYPWLEDLYSKDIYDVGDNRIVRKELVRALVREAWSGGSPRIETRSLTAHQESRLFYQELGMYIIPELELKGFRLDLPAKMFIPKESMHVRPATRSDARAIWTFIQSSAQVQGVAGRVNRKRPIEKLEAALDHHAFECLIVEYRGVPQGFAIFYQAYSSWEQHAYMMIEDLHTLFPRQGAAGALFTRLHQIAEERGYSRLETRIRETTLSAPNAVKFVEAMGMRSVAGPQWRTFRLELTPAVFNKLELYDLAAQ